MLLLSKHLSFLRNPLVCCSKKMSTGWKEDARKSCFAAARNKEHIANVLKQKIEQVLHRDGVASLKILEIASGTGEHAENFLFHIPEISLYQPTDIDETMHESIAAWTEPFGDRVLPPFALNMLQVEAGIDHLATVNMHGQVDVVVCINMIHIAPFSCTHGLFQVAGRILRPGGFVLTYGPYRVSGEMVESNVKFDESLKSRNSEWGVRDLEAVQSVALTNGLELKETVSMPANNLCVVFEKL